MSGSLHKKINGFHPPTSCPRDFAAQVQGLVWKYNKLIDDCDSYQQSLRDMSNNYRVISKKYEELQTASEKLAEKYEKLVASHSPHSPRKDSVPSDEDDDNAPLNEEEIETVLAVADIRSKKGDAQK